MRYLKRAIWIQNVNCFSFNPFTDNAFSLVAVEKITGHSTIKLRLCLTTTFLFNSLNCVEFSNYNFLFKSMEFQSVLPAFTLTFFICIMLKYKISAELLFLLASIFLLKSKPNFDCGILCGEITVNVEGKLTFENHNIKAS